MFDTFEARVYAARSGTHAIIDLDGYARNIREMRNRLASHRGAQLMAVVKANAYGHGAVMCARTAIASGAGWLGVARIEEGVELRDHHVHAPLLALGPLNPAMVQLAAERRIAIAVGSTGGLERIRRALDLLGDRTLEVHLKIDSGMHRYGVLPEEAIATASALATHPNIELAGLFTHFATADEADDRFLREQQRRFDEAQTRLAEAGIRPRHVHVTNSAASLRGTTPGIDGGATSIFRAGIATYGLPPSEDVPLSESFRRVMTMTTRLGRVFTLPAGEGVSYGQTYVANEPTLCGTVPIGYGDGMNRLLSNRGWMSVHGRRCPILGRVCMDQTVIDLTAAPEASEGDEVVVLGDGSRETMTADDVAGIIGTINYEVTTAVLPRVPRVFVRDGQPVAVQDLFGLHTSNGE